MLPSTVSGLNIKKSHRTYVRCDFFYISKLGSLPEKCREIFILACIEGLKYKEVAERLDVSVNTVKTQLKSAYSKLRTEFNEKDLEIIALLIFLGYM